MTGFNGRHLHNRDITSKAESKRANFLAPVLNWSCTSVASTCLARTVVEQYAFDRIKKKGGERSRCFGLIEKLAALFDPREGAEQSGVSLAPCFILHNPCSRFLQWIKSCRESVCLDKEKRWKANSQKNWVPGNGRKKICKWWFK